MFDILIIDKSKKTSFMKVMNIENLYKKIGLKSEEGFLKHCEWNISISNYPQLYINFYGKKIGKANNENKFNFPPPLDKEIFFGKCILVAYTKNNKEVQYISLNEELWNNIYLNLSSINDSIVDIPKSKKIFLKNDDLHLSSSDTDDESETSEDEEDEEVFEDEELIEDPKEENIEKIYVNHEIELIEENYLSSSEDEDEDVEEEEEDDEDEDEGEDEDDMEYDDDDGDEVECDIECDIVEKTNISMKIN
jgi:hypothetical protein